ncbi:YceI family protein [Bogoriella caseilytica]|uniref:Polyisoprenoid-binding protein YceI n=1 Tax=Bogoriella caseilytica TaxID=56055 RepID=A0A3N2BAX4_9MICO|nr:YceI family protein [Bogoriella caseilytica]ROR72338.1 polyisoprenoid-binding protein YceI [Bogoriella caseilytica]
MSAIPAGTYTIDNSHSELSFSVRHAGISRVRGKFESYTGTIQVAENLADSQANVTIQSASVNTGDENRDNHLRSADFWDAENKPEWTFVSTGVSGSSDEEFTLTGDLTINGVTKPVELEVEYNGSAVDPFGNTRVGFAAKTAISRKEFDLTWNAALEAGGVLVGDKISIELDISAIPQG